MKDKEECIIRIIKWIKKIKEYYEIIKADFIKTLSGTKAECTLPFDYDVLERVVRCVFPDIVKYYEEKRKPEVSAPLTDDAILSDNEGVEKSTSENKGGIKILQQLFMQDTLATVKEKNLLKVSSENAWLMRNDRAFKFLKLILTEHYLQKQTTVRSFRK